MQHDFYARAFRIERLGGSPESLLAAISSSEHGPRRSMNIFLSHGTRKFSVPRKPEPPTMKKRWESALGRRDVGALQAYRSAAWERRSASGATRFGAKDSLQQRDRA